MSIVDLDRCAANRRMADYLKPEQLNDEACLQLAEVLLAGMAEDLTRAARRYAEFPNEENLYHLKVYRDTYKSNLFSALSCGVADGDIAVKRIVQEALRGKRAK